MESRPWMIWTGRALSALFVLFMLGASVAPKLLGMAVAEDTLKALGWPHGYALMIGLIELAGTVLYVIPATSLLGAIIMTGLFGGAIATQVRAESPLFSHILFSFYLAAFMWGGLWLRDARIRSILPIRRVAEGN
ncbi:MAG TPA: DoxX family protein [Ensifer sp.]|nr:DoxX family protein [Ensifer sp.]